MNVPLWRERCDAVSVTLFSAPMDASQFNLGALFLQILALGTGNVSIIVEHSLDPNNPNSWTTLATVAGSAVGEFPGAFGGESSGTTVAVGPYIRFRAGVTVSAGAVTWSATATLRR